MIPRSDDFTWRDSKVLTSEVSDAFSGWLLLVSPQKLSLHPIRRVGFYGLSPLPRYKSNRRNISDDDDDEKAEGEGAIVYHHVSVQPASAYRNALRHRD